MVALLAARVSYRESVLASVRKGSSLMSGWLKINALACDSRVPDAGLCQPNTLTSNVTTYARALRLAASPAGTTRCHRPHMAPLPAHTSNPLPAKRCADLLGIPPYPVAPACWCHPDS